MILKYIISFLFLFNNNFVNGNDYERENNFINIYNSNEVFINNNTLLVNNTKNNIYETNVGFSNGMKDFTDDIFNKYYNISHKNCLLKCKITLNV